MVGPHILTWSGRRFYFFDSGIDSIVIEDIARALSKLCRFTGHCCVRDDADAVYTVAQHSVMVSRLLPFEEQLHGLLHDAAEAYVGDMSAPLKGALPEVVAFEDRVQQRIARRFGIPGAMTKGVHQADMIMLATERRDLMAYSDDVWPALVGVEPMVANITPWSPRIAYHSFMGRFEALTA